MSMNNKIEVAKEWISHADAILVTASNGFSISEGYHIFANDTAFKRYFSDFQEKYGITNIVQGWYFNFPDEVDEEKFNQAVIKYMVEDYSGHRIFRELKNIIGEKDYFIVTSNVDTHFQLNGFDDNHIFEIEGNIIDGINFESQKWATKNKALNNFLKKYSEKKLLVLELGIGSQNTLIKVPIMQWIEEHPNSKYITLNLPQEINILEGIERQSLALAGPISDTFKELLRDN